MDGGKGRSLTRREFDAVIRRAAELAESDPDAPEGLVSEGELLRIAREVGLDESHVRHALAEVRVGAGGTGPIDRLFGPSLIGASRIVPGTPELLADQLDEFLVANQLLQPVRRTPALLMYRPAVDWASQLARAASFSSRKYYIASARSVEVHLETVEDERTRVEFTIDPGMRGDDVASAAVFGTLGGGGAGVLTAWGLATVAPLGLAIGVGLVIAGGLFGVISYGVGRSHKKKLTQVRAETEGVLDSLESGASLEPPPASWRRWVKRNFHGVARDLMSSDD
jgi:hypothetical protein